MPVHRLTSVTVGVPDVAANVAFYEEFGLTRSSPGVLASRDGGDQLRLVPADRRFSSMHGGGPCLIDHVLVSERLFRAVREVAYYNEALRYHGPHVEDVPPTEDSDHALAIVAFDGG